ncbi:MAG TPA: NifB/NifX family molybdenum-iron cluster-binding protein [Spirochaetota bacterium]|nr:NifB/NifX family molybdenum-iron cluster-binding protein [Spirochaetota bacterium]
MKIAIPVARGRLCMHFGHCEHFAIIDVNETTREILGEEYLTPPPHEPGILPKWLAEKGAHCIIAGGMGGRAQQIFNEFNIRVVTGAPSSEPREVVEHFLNDSLVLGQNTCDH